MKLGGFFCTCAGTAGINYKEVGDAIRNRFRAFVVHDLLCTGEGQANIVDYARRGLIDAALIGCTAKATFEALGEKLELPFYYVNLREHCGWVHGKEEATEKGRRMIAARIAELELCGEALPCTLEAGDEVLIVGDSPEVLEVAQAMSGAAKVKVLTPSLMGVTHIPAGSMELTLGRLKDVMGEIGGFTAIVEPGPISFGTCISCGKCLDACPRGAVSLVEYRISDECDACGRCIDACPVDAISLDRGVEELHAGQVIIAGSTLRGKAGLYHAAGDAGSLEGAALKAVVNLGRTVKPMAVEAELRDCAAGKSRLEGCTLCESSCPHGAVIRDGDRISFSRGSCGGCGACAAVCPVSLPRFNTAPREAVHGQMEALLNGGHEKKVLLFACEEMSWLLDSLGRERRMYYPVLPLFVPCLNALSELEVLRAYDLGADGVITLGCGPCPHGAVYKSAVEFSKRVLEVFDAGERLLLLQSPEPEEFAARVEEFAGSLGESPLKRGGGLTLENKRDGLLELFERFSSSTGNVPDKILEGGAAFGLLEVDGSRCTLCNTCSVMCPREALRKDGNALLFAHRLCIACGLCEKSCPEGALTLRRALDFTRLAEDGEAVFKGEVFTCPSCGKATISKNALQVTVSRLGEDSPLDPELLKFCPDCRALKVLGLTGGGGDR